MSTNSYGWVNKYSLPTGRILFILPQKGAEDGGGGAKALAVERGQAEPLCSFQSPSPQWLFAWHTPLDCVWVTLCHNKALQPESPEAPPEGEEGPLGSCLAAGTVHVS